MSLVLPPPKLVLLAVHLAINADIDNLASLTSRYPTVLRKDLVLRILLMYLPETVNSSDYVLFIEELSTGEIADRQAGDIDCTIVESLSDEDAIKRVRKLRLSPLAWDYAPFDTDGDPITLFLLRRAHRVDEEAGLLTQVPDLLRPFLQYAPDIRAWTVSTVLPLIRRNYDYYPTDGAPCTLAEFQSLPDVTAVSALLSQTGRRPGDYHLIGRDLRGLLMPWLHSNARWRQGTTGSHDEPPVEGPYCQGWERALEWLLAQSGSNWRAAVAAVEQWGGAVDVDLGAYDAVWLSEEQQQYLDRRYARAVLACAYLVPEATEEALEGAHQMLRKVIDLLGKDDTLSLRKAASSLPAISGLDGGDIMSPRNTAFMRDDLLRQSNPLTTPSTKSTHLLHGLISSAFILTSHGLPCSVKKAGDLAFVQDEQEQKTEAIKLVHAISEQAPRHEDKFWIEARCQLLWLRSWGQDSSSDAPLVGIFAKVKAEVIETEVLKSLLSSGRYSLAKLLYEDTHETPFPARLLQETVIAAALNAYDNASNPNRTRGGLKKCDEMWSLPERRRIEALLRATHALSDYRLVLRQGEPFSPVVLRVHSDPISIIAILLEQNPKSYTQNQDLAEVGSNMIRAGLVNRDKRGLVTQTSEDEEAHIRAAEKRITAMCIDAALKEDDFETAYSYVVNRLSGTADGSVPALDREDAWSWKAALQAGQYMRTTKTLRPTHLGNTSGNPDIRHLEQRIDCLSIALRIAPPPQLQEILKTFRRCEEQLDSALKEEAAREEDIDAAADLGMPGGFDAAPIARPHRPAGGQNRAASTAASKGGDEAPMSLFDLSRATARAASRNFAALSSLQQSAGGKGPYAGNMEAEEGWLIGAPAPQSEHHRRND
ncbi:Protein transport protein sec39 [Colletotrichum spinosum]|uniref:Protein transport protein sec39 n=1 Tax=Colletotrichum spinosum TaxID=1347390 RepID=A0A4R8Q0X3_9PEZI|nr:Protein transport protein sec39 [Colletotrichum spinosum]